MISCNAISSQPVVIVPITRLDMDPPSATYAIQPRLAHAESSCVGPCSTLLDTHILYFHCELESLVQIAPILSQSEPALRCFPSSMFEMVLRIGSVDNTTFISQANRTAREINSVARVQQTTKATFLTPFPYQVPN